MPFLKRVESSKVDEPQSDSPYQVGVPRVRLRQMIIRPVSTSSIRKTWRQLREPLGALNPGGHFQVSISNDSGISAPHFETSCFDYTGRVILPPPLLPPVPAPRPSAANAGRKYPGPAGELQTERSGCTWIGVVGSSRRQLLSKTLKLAA